jgi:autotransporter-associated beta strand protein
MPVNSPLAGNGLISFLGTGYGGQTGYILNATNPFTGPVTLTLARIQGGAGALSFGSPSSITVNPGSQVYAVATPYSSIYNMPLTLSGAGWPESAGLLGALRIENGGTWAGNITLAANARIGVNNATTNTISGTISGNYELETYGGNASAGLILSPSAANTYNALRVSIGTAGAKTIAGNNNAIPNNIPLVMNGGTLWLNGFSKTFSSFLNLNGSSSIQNGSTTSPATVTLTPLLGSSSYSGNFADAATTQPLNPLNVTLTQTPGQWLLNLTGSSPNWTGNLTNNGGSIVIATGTSYMGNNNAARYLVCNNGGSFVWNINNVFGNGTANTAFPTIVLNPGCAVSNNNYNVIGPVVLNGGTLGGIRNSTGYRRYQFRGTVTVIGSAPSYIAPSGFGSGDHLDTSTTFNVADVTGNANSDLIVSDLLANRSADYTGTGSLVKTGAGTLELDGANTYTGSTTISQGTLALGASAALVSPNITIASGATLDVGAMSSGLTLPANAVLKGSGTINGSLTDNSGTSIQPGGNGVAGTLTITTNLTLNGAGALPLDLSSSTVSGNDKIQVNGNLNLSPSTPTPVSFNFLNGAPALGTPYTLIQCNGTITGTGASLTNNQGLLVTFNVVGNQVQATFTAPNQSLTWLGDGSANAWDLTTTSTNWFNASASALTNFYQLDTVRFDDTAAVANTTVNLGTAVMPANVTVDSTNNYNLTGSGSIAGNGGLTKNNTNTLTVSVASSFTGPVNVNGGVLKQGNNNAMPQNAVITLTNGSQFDLAGFGNSTTRNYSFTFGGSGPDGNGALVNSGASIFGNASVASLTLTTNATIGNVSGRWDMGSGQTGTVLNGNGYNLTIKNNANGMSIRPQLITNVASITLSSGLMWYEGFPQTNSWTATTTNYIMPGATVGNYGNQPVTMPIVLTNATIWNQGNGTPNWVGPIILQGTNVFNNSAAQTFSGVISGPGGFNIGGGSTTAGAVPPTLTFSNASTFAGGVTISNAPVTLTNNVAVGGTAAVVVTSSNALGTGPITFALSQMTTNAATNTARILECNITNGGVLPNAIVLPASSMSGTVSNISIQGRDSTSVFTLSGQISGGFTGLTNWVDFGDSGSSGVLRLANNANNFVANIYCDRGVLALTGDGCLGNSANVLKLDQASANGGLRFDGAGINIAHNIIANSTISMSLFGDNNGDGVPETANNATISGIISGGGQINIVRSTNCVLTLTGVNTFNNDIELQCPMTLQVAASANLGTAAVAIKAGTLRYTGAGSETMTRTLWNDNAALSGATIDVPTSTASLTWNPGGGTCSQILTKTGAGALTMGTLGMSGPVIENGGSFTVNSVISGSTTYVRVSSGTLTLNGAETYVGPTLVNGGALVLNGSLPAGNSVSVASSAVLGGNGTINCPVAVQSGATFQPGAGGATVGKLTVNGPLNLAGNTVMYLNKSTPTNSQVAGSSAIVYGGTLNVTNLGGTLVAGDNFTLFSGGAGSGNFASIAGSPGAGLAYSFNPTNGVLSVVANGPSGPGTITNSVTGGNTLNLAWPGGQGWRLVSQTNTLSVGIVTNSAAWGTVPGAADGSYSIALDPTKPTVFYRLVYP